MKKPPAILLLLILLLVFGVRSNAESRSKHCFISETDKSISDKALKAYWYSLTGEPLPASAFVHVVEGSLKEIKDDALGQQLPNTRFYYMEIFNGSHYEYNLGRIKVIVSVNQQKPCDIQLLFPFDYCCSEADSMFMQANFCNHIVNTAKKELCTAIATLFFRVKTFATINCDSTINDLKYTTDTVSSIIRLTTSYQLNCSNNSVKSMYEEKNHTLFTFKDDTLKSIDFSAWR